MGGRETRWFTDVTKATVPVDFIPTDEDARGRESVRRASVDAEAEGGLAGALRTRYKESKCWRRRWWRYYKGRGWEG